MNPRWFAARAGLSTLGIVAVVTVALAAPRHSAAARPGAARASARSARSAKPDSNEVLVRIGKDVITRADVQHRIDALPEQFRSNYATPEGRQQLLDRMVEERVWLAEATRHGIGERPTVRAQIEQQRRDLLIRTYLNEVMARSAAVSDSDAHAYYLAHESEFKVPAQISVRHIQTKSESDAKRVKQWAKSGQDWVGLAKKYSADTLTRNTGGNLGLVSKDGLFGTLGSQPALSDSAFTLKDGQIGGPYKTDRGWHVLRVDQVKPASIRPFDQVKSLITRQVGTQRQQDFYKAELDSARRALGTHVDSSAVKRFISQRRTAREMFNDAQALGPPEQRIEAYRKLLADYPTSEVSPQAQFMIGFIQSEELKKYDDAERSFKTLLANYPKAELAPSARWMIEHMRTQDAPAFINLDSDSTGAGTHAAAPGRAAAGAPKPASGAAPRTTGKGISP